MALGFNIELECYFLRRKENRNSRTKIFLDQGRSQQRIPHDGESGNGPVFFYLVFNSSFFYVLIQTNLLTLILLPLLELNLECILKPSHSVDSHMATRQM